MALPILPAQRATLWPGGLSVMTPPPLVFPATRSELHGLDFDVSAVPLEDSSIVADHVQELPESPVFEVVLTDFPGLPTAPTNPLGPDQYMLLWHKLKRFVRTRQPFDFSCALETYTNMVAKRVSAPRTAESGKSMVCTLVLRKIEISTVDEAKVLADAALAMALGEQDLGEVAFDAAL